MNLLRDGITQGFVIKTDRATKLTIDGITETYPVYQIRLDALYYNDQNDRIATWISQYKSDNKTETIDRTDLESYNNIIHEFIVKSNPDKLKSTQKNISFIGQQKYGVVLNDGRIIDGNRRFTCLRNLAVDDPKFNYFEAVILDRDIENSAKQIKMLELHIQIGEEARVDYDPIDRLVGIYNDIIVNKILTVHEYAVSTGAQSDNDVQKEVERAKLLAEFLEAINAPRQFYIARDLNMSNPLIELQAILRKIKDEDKKEEVKYAVFTNCLLQPEGDMTRFLRQLKAVAGSNYLDEFIEKELEIAESVIDNLPEVGQVNKEVINQLRKDEETKRELRKTMDIVTNKAKASATRDKPNQILLKAVDSIETIDMNIFKKLTNEQKSEIEEHLSSLENLIVQLREAINE